MPTTELTFVCKPALIQCIPIRLQEIACFSVLRDIMRRTLRGPVAPHATQPNSLITLLESVLMSVPLRLNKPMDSLETALAWGFVPLDTLPKMIQSNVFCPSIVLPTAGLIPFLNTVSADAPLIHYLSATIPKKHASLFALKMQMRISLVSSLIKNVFQHVR